MKKHTYKELYAKSKITKEKWKEAQTLYEIADLEQENDKQLGYMFDHVFLGQFNFDDGTFILISLKSDCGNYYCDVYAVDENGKQVDFYDYEDIDEIMEFEINNKTYICKFIIEGE